MQILAREARAPLRVGGDVVALLGGDLFDFGVVRQRVGHRIVFALGDEDLAVRPVPRRNLMTPPDLPGNAPRLDIVHPVEERRFPLRRHEHGLAFAHRRDRRLRQRLGVDVPLIGEKRLEHRAGAVAVRHDVAGRLDLVDEAARLKLLDDEFSCGFATLAFQRIQQGQFGMSVLQKRFVLLERQVRFVIEHINKRQVVPLADFKVVEVVRRRDLDRAGAFFRIGVVVADDRNAPADQRQDRGLADQMFQPLVLRMHRDRDVAEHGLGPRRRHDDEFVAAFDRIFDVPEIALGLDLLHFEIGDRGFQLRVPIDQPLVLVDEALAIERDEHLEHRARQALVHGEALARPVAGGAEPLELADDGAAGLRLPFPDPLDEGLAAHGAARFLALHQLPLDHRLGGDAGVIGARLPQHVTPAHALEAAEDVLQRVVERVAHMQRAGDVGRRDDDAIGFRLGALGPAGPEGAGLLPGLVNAAFDRAGLICLLDHFDFPGRALESPRGVDCQRQRPANPSKAPT